MKIQDEADLERAFHVLIHHIRAPLSVAQGYLRLLKDGHLTSAEDRARAYENAMNAIGAIARLCDDASAYVSPKPEPLRMAVAVEDFVARVDQACRDFCTEQILSSVGDTPAGEVVLERPAHIVADSLAVLFCTSRGAAKNAGARAWVCAGDGELRFLLGTEDTRERLTREPPESFDPWRGTQNLSLALACRTIADAGGRVWALATAPRAIGVAFPRKVSGT